jgi:DNA processing protein
MNAAGPGQHPKPKRPALTDHERLCRLRLIRSRRVGPVTWHRMLAEHGSAAAAMMALPEIARQAGVEGYQPCPEAVALHEMRAALAVGARMLVAGDAEYPAALSGVADAPPVLWARGDLTMLARPMLAMVGARNASSLGLRMARQLSAGLSEAGFVVVSGLARGIDTEAHEHALSCGTVAVLAGGVDVIYPPENAALAARIADAGVLLSEQPPGIEAQARHFPLRNRIISGLAHALVVVEAAARSGSLITAKEAAEQGREVLAVPGHPLDPRAAGCNQLIREGATLVRSVADVIEAVGPALDAPSRPVQFHTSKARAEPDALPPVAPEAAAGAGHVDLGRLILDRLSPSPVAEDQLIRDLALPAQVVMPELLLLELAGDLLRHPGGMVSRA